MIDYDKFLEELREEKAACQYAYGEMVPAFYTQALRKAIEDIEECRDCAAEATRMARGGAAGMTRSEEIELEIRQQAVRLYPKCAALFELPLMVYAQIMEDNATRKRPYRVSEARVRKVIGSMPEFQ